MKSPHRRGRPVDRAILVKTLPCNRLPVKPQPVARTISLCTQRFAAPHRRAKKEESKQRRIMDQPSKPIPTIQQVARAAGVARSTVSRAFTRPDMLSPATVAR